MANYRYEWVSGPVPVPVEFSVTVLVGVVNRGRDGQHVHAYVYSGSEVLFNSENDPVSPPGTFVPAGSEWGRQKQLEHLDPSCDMYWVRIYTTSLDLVPSVGPIGLTGNEVPRFPYLGVGDFVRFVHSNFIDPFEPVPVVGSEI